MTVIGNFFIGDNPFMISDLLISMKVSPRDWRFQKLPDPIQRFNLRLPTEAKYTITDVRQKTVRIADRFVLSYSGPLSQAECVIEHFRKLTQTAPSSDDMFRRETTTLERTGRIDQNCSVIALIEGGGRIFAGTYNIIGLRSRKFRYLRAGGSGAKDLLDVFAGYRGKDTNRELNSLEEGLSLSLALSSVLLGKEMVTGEPLQRAYGGFYEISYWNGTDFAKLTDVLHLHSVFQYRRSQGLFFDLPVKIQKLTYHDSILYLRDLELTPDKASNDTVYIVREPGRLKTAQPPKIKPDFSYKWLVNHLYIILPNGQVRYRNHVQHIQRDNYGLYLDEQGPELQMKFKHDYFEFLKEEIVELEKKPALPG